MPPHERTHEVEDDLEEEFDPEYEDDSTPADYAYEGGRIREISWEGPEHHHTEKTSDQYWALGILVVVGSVTMIVLDNLLFGIVLLLIGATTALMWSRVPHMIPYSVSLRGIRIGSELHPYSTLKCFFLDEDHPRNVQLLVQSNSIFTPLLVIPVPDEAIEDIEYILETRLQEEHLEVPLGHRILEFLGF